MKTAVCTKCGLQIQVRNKVPKKCPRCGYDESRADMRQKLELLERAAQRRREAEARRIWKAWAEK